MTASFESPAIKEGGLSLASLPGDLSSFASAIWGSPLWAGTVSFVVYAALAALFSPYGLGATRNPYYAYLGEALLHGQLALVNPPPSLHDLSLYQGRLYLYWPPFPALLFLPLVALFGVGVSDTVVTLFVAGLNVALVSWLLRALDAQGIVELSLEKRAWLTAFFAFGTVHVTLAPYGRVWNTGQLVAFATLSSAYLVALRLPRRWAPIASGVLVAGAFLSRNSTLLAAGWIAWYLWISRDRSDRTALLRIAVAGLLPILIAGLALGWYNAARFGNPLEFGIAYHQMAVQFETDYHRYGMFSPHYLGVNLFYNFLAFPPLALLGSQPDVDFWMGGSLFLMSPLFLLAVPGMVRRWRTGGWVLLASCVAGLMPALLVMGTGWVEYGPRYTLDMTVPLLVATAMGASRVSTSLVARLSLMSFAVYMPGVALLGRVM